MLDKYTSVSGSSRKFLPTSTQPDVAPVDTTTYNAIAAAIPSYYAATSFTNKASYFKVLDIAKRLNAGTGSLGTPR
jgi:hypothetical protein